MPNLLKNEGYSYSVVAIDIIGFLYCTYILIIAIPCCYQDIDDEIEEAQLSAVNESVDVSSMAVNASGLRIPSTYIPSIDKDPSPEYNHQSTVRIKNEQ